jgi:hypothetical protein
LQGKKLGVVWATWVGCFWLITTIIWKTALNETFLKVFATNELLRLRLL